MEAALEEGVYIYCINESKEPLLFGAIRDWRKG